MESRHLGLRQTKTGRGKYWVRDTNKGWEYLKGWELSTASGYDGCKAHSEQMCDGKSGTLGSGRRLEDTAMCFLVSYLGAM